MQDNYTPNSYDYKRHRSEIQFAVFWIIASFVALGFGIYYNIGANYYNRHQFKTTEYVANYTLTVNTTTDTIVNFKLYFNTINDQSINSNNISVICNNNNNTVDQICIDETIAHICHNIYYSDFNNIIEYSYDKPTVKYTHILLYIMTVGYMLLALVLCYFSRKYIQFHYEQYRKNKIIQKQAIDAVRAKQKANDDAFKVRNKAIKKNIQNNENKHIITADQNIYRSTNNNNNVHVNVHSSLTTSRDMVSGIELPLMQSRHSLDLAVPPSPSINYSSATISEIELPSRQSIRSHNLSVPLSPSINYSIGVIPSPSQSTTNSAIFPPSPSN